MSEIQFGVNLHAISCWQYFQQFVRRADELGYDVFAAPDHLGALAPFAALTAAATISEAITSAHLRAERRILEPGCSSPAR